LITNGDYINKQLDYVIQLKNVHKFINGNFITNSISSVDISNPNVKVIALDSRVETEVESKIAA